VISNARCLTEGVDVPAVDMVAFISPRKSKVDIVQATGRAMRKSPGKEFGYVMVPLFVEQAADESIEEALHRTGFDDVWDLLGAMREQDDVLTDIIRQMREDKGRTGGYDESRFSEHVEVLGPSVSLDTIRESITAECLESLGATWDERFGELLAYKVEYGNLNIPQRHHTPLGIWVRHQRAAMNVGRLSSERKGRLEEIGFEWDMLSSKWEAMFNELLQYKAEHGHANVPTNWPTYLGTWVTLQRKARKASSRGVLSPDRKKRLDEIGFIWDALDFQWEERFNELVAYKTDHGDVDVPSKWPSGLGKWVSQQRVSYKNELLSNERKMRLEEIGVAWDSFDTKWEAGISELLQYKAEHGDVNVPKNWPGRLASWVAVQREFHKKGKLLSERKKRLDEIGFEWNIHDSKWDAFYKELLEYKVQHGDTKVPINWSTELGQWVRHQRVAKINGKILLDRECRLNEIGFSWGINEKRNAK